MALIDRMRIRTGEESDELLEECLLEATEAYMAHRFPVSAHPDSVEPEYEGLVLAMAIDIYNKIGAEGQRSHSENGISRSYSGDWISHDLLARIVPLCGVTG